MVPMPGVALTGGRAGRAPAWRRWGASSGPGPAHRAELPKNNYGKVLQFATALRDEVLPSTG